MVKRTSIKYPLVSEYISIYNAEDHSIYSWNGIGIEYLMEMERQFMLKMQ